MAKVAASNCVSEIKIPSRVESVDGFDYNSVLGLFATFNHDDGLSVWNPVSEQVVAEFDLLGKDYHDTLFLPGDRVAVSSSDFEDFNGGPGGSLEIFTLGQDKCDLAKFQVEDLPIDMPGAIALSPNKNLLVTHPYDFHQGVYEIFVDWDNFQILKSREILPGYQEIQCGILLLCCSQDFKVARYGEYPPNLSTAKVCFNLEGEAQIEEQEAITYYRLEGEEREIGELVNGIVHDGQSLIIANEDEIVLLESMTEGSNAHLIASGVNSTGQMRINHEGQLMVCEEKAIKLFDYKCNPRPLQDLCRCNIRKRICTDYRDKVNSLAIPFRLKHYLLYKY